MTKRTTSWNLLDFLLIGVSGLAMINQWQLATRQLTRMLPPSQLEGISALLYPEMLAASAVAMGLLVLVLRRFDGLAERLVGAACSWGIWYFTLATLFSNLVFDGLLGLGSFSS